MKSPEASAHLSKVELVDERVGRIPEDVGGLAALDHVAGPRGEAIVDVSEALKKKNNLILSGKL